MHRYYNFYTCRAFLFVYVNYQAHAIVFEYRDGNGSGGSVGKSSIYVIRT